MANTDFDSKVFLRGASIMIAVPARAKRRPAYQPRAAAAAPTSTGATTFRPLETTLASVSAQFAPRRCSAGDGVGEQRGGAEEQ